LYFLTTVIKRLSASAAASASASASAAAAASSAFDNDRSEVASTTGSVTSGYTNRTTGTTGTTVSTTASNVYIPYRNSKLTRILQPSLGGNARTVIICCITPSERQFSETVSTLKFAGLAQNVKNVVYTNVVPTTTSTSSALVDARRGSLTDTKTDSVANTPPSMPAPPTPTAVRAGSVILPPPAAGTVAPDAGAATGGGTTATTATSAEVVKGGTAADSATMQHEQSRWLSEFQSHESRVAEWLAEPAPSLWEQCDSVFEQIMELDCWGGPPPTAAAAVAAAANGSFPVAASSSTTASMNGDDAASTTASVHTSDTATADSVQYQQQQEKAFRLFQGTGACRRNSCAFGPNYRILLFCTAQI
jgi:hypothetical protein